VVDPVESKRDRILELARRHGVTRVRLFGSMARGDARPDSDVDLLVDVGPELLGRRVQIVTEHGLDHLLRDRILQEAVPL
jgi:predicted nucleotidyltransferase